MLGPPLHSLKRNAEARGFSVEYTARVVDIAKALADMKVPTIFSLMHLATLSNTRWDELRSTIRRKKEEKSDYTVFLIRKRAGGNRLICAPKPNLRRVQSWIHSHVLCSPGALGRLHSGSTAYAPGSSIRLNAIQHSGCAWMVKLDIKDFFESISERQVYRVFRSLGYPALLSFEMARLCTRIVPPRKDGALRKRDKMWRWTNSRESEHVPYSAGVSVGHLPQGAPTSAMLANLVVAELDKKIQEIANDNGATYTRYADDIVLTLGDSNRRQCDAIFSAVVKQITNAGFRVNRAKSRVRGPGTRKVVTGLVTNDLVPRLPRSTKEDILLSLYHIKKHGLLGHIERRNSRSPQGYLNHLVGRIVFAQSIEADFGKRAMNELRNVLIPHKDLFAMIRTLQPTADTKNPFENLHRLIFDI